MNLTGDLRYVSAAEYAAFAHGEPAELRTEAFHRFVATRRKPMDETRVRTEFDARYPPGFFAHRQAFSPRGRYGSWLLERPLLVVIDDWAFAHAGLAEATIELGAEGVNGILVEQLVEYMEALDALTAAGILSPADDFYDHAGLLARFEARVESGAGAWPDGLAAAAGRIRELQSSLVFGPDSPAWYRGNVGCSVLTERDRFIAALNAVGADHLVIGHTPTFDAIVQSRMDQRLVRIDTGMLQEYYGGRAAALVIEGADVSARYEDEAAAADPVPQPRRVGLRPGRMRTEDLEEFLANAEVLSLSEDGERWRRVSLRQDDIELAAYFTPADRSGALPDVAAYRLDRMLGLDMVPETVARKIGGEAGSLQYAPPRAITETERSAQRLGDSAWCPRSDQFQSMYVFDSLIFNEGRTVDRIRYSTDNFQLMLVGHDLSFSTDSGRPPHLTDVPLLITEAWAGALAALDEDALGEALGDILDRRRIRALLERRDRILETAGTR
jgi:hypothetical protein